MNKTSPNHSSRHRARQQALQILYQMDLAGNSSEVALNNFTKNFEHHQGDLSFVRELVDGIKAEQAAIDALIEQHAQNWTLARMSPIDRNLLRLGVFEICFGTKTAGPIVINEAVEIAKKFGNQETAEFVNGILDAVWKTQTSQG